jgi:hypothetical protein
MHLSHANHTADILQPQAGGDLQSIIFTFPYNGVLLSQLYNQSMEKPSL